jgi:hypothetical protein
MLKVLGDFLGFTVFERLNLLLLCSSTLAEGFLDISLKLKFGDIISDLRIIGVFHTTE